MTLLRPDWGNAQGQLPGFLAYDLVLIVPFLNHFATVKSDLRIKLVLYTGVLIYSGALPAYYNIKRGCAGEFNEA
jgi:hypothetical protein